MKLKEFNEMYNIGRNHCHVIHTTKQPNWIMKTKPKGNKKQHDTTVNVGFLEKYQDKRIAWINQAQTLYFDLMDTVDTQYGLARILADGDTKEMYAWSEFMQNTLFNPNLIEYGILNMQMPKRLISFIRKARAYLRNINEDVFN